MPLGKEVYWLDEPPQMTPVDESYAQIHQQGHHVEPNYHEVGRQYGSGIGLRRQREECGPTPEGLVLIRQVDEVANIADCICPLNHRIRSVYECVPTTSIDAIIP